MYPLTFIKQYRNPSSKLDKDNFQINSQNEEQKYKFYGQILSISNYNNQMNIQVEHQGKTTLIQENPQSLANLKQLIQQIIGIPFLQQNLLLHSKLLNQVIFDSSLLKNQTVHLRMGLAGGKGGFGAKMKNQGSKKNKGNNTKFSRDLTGKKLDYANVKKDCIDYYKKKIEEDKLVEEQRKKYKIMQMTINQENKSGRIDRKHKENLQQKANDIMESIKIGLANKTKKEKNEEQQQENGQQSKTSKIEIQGDIKQIDQPQDQSKDSVKRKRPQDVLQEQQNREPKKMLKLSAPEQVNVVKVEDKKQQKPKMAFLSAADKLKSLFKK